MKTFTLRIYYKQAKIVAVVLAASKEDVLPFFKKEKPFFDTIYEYIEHDVTDNGLSFSSLYPLILSVNVDVKTVCTGNEPVVYQKRWYDNDKNTVTYGQWYEWENCTEQQYYEIGYYIERGYSYDRRALFIGGV